MDRQVTRQPSCAGCYLTHTITDYSMHSSNPLSGICVPGLGSPEGSSKLHEEVSQMPTASTPVVMLLSAKHASIALWWDVPYGWLERRLGPGLLMVLYIIQATQKWTVEAVQSLSGTTLKDTGEGKFLQWAEL